MPRSDNLPSGQSREPKIISSTTNSTYKSSTNTLSAPNGGDRGNSKNGKKFYNEPSSTTNSTYKSSTNTLSAPNGGDRGNSKNGKKFNNEPSTKDAQYGGYNQ
ncbi:hypothetical protein K470DRAFT_273045 [Piedraia hortae CBS 480.64]|uniref:Uncharacterized protein n=1 Tax=Piedraia hortae CBS 480.64 TaxID=1314780 RepID=A0A6A7BS50_9PEZI|nr:hypothetical protein K470DRAFT_273045 [Piedraia hortae CBS 480.64]